MSTVGVVGAGTMGRGIGQLAAVAGFDAVLCDSSAAALEAALEQIAADLERRVERGRLEPEAAAAARERLRTTTELAGLAGCELIVEAVPEDLELKRSVLSHLPAEAIVATNTSALSVGAIARGAPARERVVGMHFFNPPPAMPLVEIVRAPGTGEEAVAVATSVAEAMGKTPIAVPDTVGFLVNRCGRPFYTEAMRLVDEGVSSPQQVDRICRLGAGFRMGPFELMDLVGIDVGFAVATTFAERSFGEPRWKPSPTQARLVAAGMLGRKSGRGWLDHSEPRPADPEPPQAGAEAGAALAILGAGAEAEALATRAGEAGFEVHRDLGPAPAEAVVFAFGASAEEQAAALAGRVVAVDCAHRSLAASGLTAAVGFHLLPPVAEARLVELTRLPATADANAEAVAAAARSLGLHAEWVDDAPAMVLGAIVAQIVNEGSFALGEGVASAEDVDTATKVGLSYPRGALAWGDELGAAAVLGRLAGLQRERSDPRHRPAPLLSRAAACGERVRDVAGPGERGLWV